MRSTVVTFACSCVLMLAASADPVISEFMASNQNGLKDEDGTRPDWLEIHNPDATPVNLGGWYLTDTAANKTKWRFPDTVLPADGYLVVFASDKNRAVSGKPLHTNFALSAGGEYLGLVKPDGVTVSSQYSPGFPQQYPDISYGIPSVLNATTFISETAPCYWIVPTSATNPAGDWTALSYSVNGWQSATQAIGYDKGPQGVDYNLEIGTNGNTQAAMDAANNPTAYVRIPFTVDAGSMVTTLKLRVKIDDGFTVYLNGHPVTVNGSQLTRRANLPLTWNSEATGFVGDSASDTYEDIDVSENIPNLVAGTNVLAFQAMNYSPGTTDFMIRAILEGNVVGSTQANAAPGYFATATPGAVNAGVEGLVIPQAVTFTKSSGTFTSAFSLGLGGATTGQSIYYTTDGTVPTAASALYDPANKPLISGSTLVRARIYEAATGRYGFTVSSQYEQISGNLASYGTSGAAFKSALPILILNNYGLGEVGDAQENARMLVYDRDPLSGYANMGATTNPALALNVGVAIRGRSSSGFPKKSYNVEVHDETGADANAAILGMPSGEDWALVGCYQYDRAFMRNPWVYEVSREAGIWAPRTRLVEVFFNQDGNNLVYNSGSATDYRGVYVLCENIRRDSNRVNIAKIVPTDITQPNVSGGYIFKIDSSDPDEFTWRTNNNQPPVGTGGDQLVIHRPKLPDLPTQQSSYLKGYFQQFEDAIYADYANNFTTRNYKNYIDAGAWVDHDIFCSYAKNVDALRLSAYFNKDRGQKIAAGPLWDFDRSVNSTDGRDADPQTWNGSGDSSQYFTFTWWGKLFTDSDFRQLYVDHWQAMRKTNLSTANVNAVLNGYLAEFKADTDTTDNPALRDTTKWYGGSVDIKGETVRMQTFLSTRGTWIDNQFTVQPTIALAPGQFTSAQSTTLTVPSGTTVYYTTDGTDPRASGGGISASAQAYTASSAIAIPATTKITARALRPGNTFTVPATAWSGPVSGVYLVNESYAAAATLRVSGINYHPLGPTAAESAAIPNVQAYDFEWIELKNVSAAPVNLQGLSLVKDAPVFAVTLPDFSLAPGAKALVVKNLAAFTLRYGAAAAARVVAAWPGYDSLNDSGDLIELKDRSGVDIAIFNYSNEDPWPGRADGGGSALVYIGTGGARTDYENSKNWNSSDAVDGTPGFDPATPVSTVVINETYSSPISPALDAIELYNTGNAEVNVGGWYVSNTPVAVTRDDYLQYRIPNDTKIAAGGYLVIDQTQFNPHYASGTAADTEFSLDGSRGGTLWLISADQAGTMGLENFEQKIDYSPVLPGIAYGRSPNGSGGFEPLAAYTPGAENTAPRIGSVQVTEIQYHPSTGNLEFVEISNVGSATESLTQWTLRGDVDYYFGAGFSLAPAESVVVVPFDPVADPAQAATFRSQYAAAGGVHLVGPWNAGDVLDDSKGNVSLRRRVPAPPDDPNYIGLMNEDDVNYDSVAPWPTTANGTGSSISRVGIHTQASEGTSWVAKSPTPGTGVNGYTAWSKANFSDDLSKADPMADPDGDGISNLAEYVMGTDPNVANTPLTPALEQVDGQDAFVLTYYRRMDVDDADLSATESMDLDAWIPAEHDDEISTTGFGQMRRAWLPLGTAGFLRLSAKTSP